MKNRLLLLMGCFCLFTACNDSTDEDKPLECDNTYTMTCNEARTGYLVCRVGVIANEACPVNTLCNPLTAQCEPISTDVPECDENTAPVCNGKNARRICKSGKLTDDPCPENTECNEATATCESIGNPNDCDENTAPVCNGKNARKICKSGTLTDEPCPENTECNEATATCDPVGQPPADKCDENTAPVCNGKNARKICKSGTLTDEPCPENTECNEATATCEPIEQPPADKCDENTAPVCSGKNARKICKSGTLTNEPCPENTECNEATATCEAVSAPGECDATYAQTCPDPKHHTYCNKGEIVTEECKAGAICNAELKDKKCKTPAVNDKCDPASFSESCYGDSVALTCDNGNVTKVDCVKEWGKGYKCDIVENYSAENVDAALCYSKEEDCETPGDSYTECDFETTEGGYDQHFTVTYICVEGVVGNHYYAAEVVNCKHSCKDKTACSD